MHKRTQEWLASNWQGVALSTGIQGKRSRPHNMTGVKKGIVSKLVTLYVAIQNIFQNL